MKRTYVFKPYSGKHRPHFILTIWNTGRRDEMGKWVYGYRFTERYPALTVCGDNIAAQSTIIFKGEDYYAPNYDNFVAAAEGLMSFLTLRDGDTDDEYFKDYTTKQRDFSEEHAEAVSAEVMARWCDENGALKKRYR